VRLEQNAIGEGIKSLADFFSRLTFLDLLFWLVDLRNQSRRMAQKRHVRFVTLIEKRLRFVLVTSLEQFCALRVNVIDHERQVQKSWRGLPSHLHQLEVHVRGWIGDECGWHPVRVMLAATTNRESQSGEMRDGGFNIVNAQCNMV
jgi:hypothetical protein